MSPRPRQHRLGGTQARGPDHFRLAADVLHHDRCAALILARHFGAWRKKLHTIALDCPSIRDVGVERGPAQRLSVRAAIFLDRPWEHISEKDPGLVEPYRDMSGYLVGFGFGLVAPDHFLRQFTDA